jgi:ATP-binding cassette subfamily C (CFTR/MRP) protein 10
VRSVDPGYIGLAISYALGITSRLSGVVSSFTETEKQLVAVERAYQYINEVSQGTDSTLARKCITHFPGFWVILGG